MSPTLDEGQATLLLDRLAGDLTDVAPPPLARIALEAGRRRRRRTRRLVGAAAAVAVLVAGTGATVSLLDHRTAPAAQHPAPITAEMRTFQGTWELVVSNAAPDGQQTRPVQWPLLRITFTGDRFTTSDGVHTIEGRFHVSPPAGDGTSTFSTSDVVSTGGNRYRGGQLPPLAETLRLANRSYHLDGRILVLGGRTIGSSAITMSIAPLGSFKGHLAGTVVADSVAHLPLVDFPLTLTSSEGYPPVVVRTDAQGGFDALVSTGTYTVVGRAGTCIGPRPILVRPGHTTRVTLSCPT